MLSLKNVDGNVEFTCEVIGYQFPGNNNDDWCFLKVTIKQEGEQCELVDPALEATELVQLENWFTCLAEKRLPKYAHLTFTEPCVSFEFLANRDSVVRIAVHLGHELTPSFKLKQFRAESSDWKIVFEIDEGQFESIRAGIKNTLLKYPVRGS